MLARRALAGLQGRAREIIGVNELVDVIALAEHGDVLALADRWWYMLGRSLDAARKRWRELAGKPSIVELTSGAEIASNLRSKLARGWTVKQLRLS